MSWFTDRHFFLLAVIVYGLSSAYSVFLWRRGFRKDDRVNYFLLLAAAALHTVAMVKRGFSISQCPVNNLYEATIFIAWTIAAAYLAVGFFHQLRFLGAFASHVLLFMGVFALMPALDPPHAAQPDFSNGLISLHATLVLLSIGAFGLSAVAAFMFLTEEHDLKFHKLRAIFSMLPPIQRLERVMNLLLLSGLFLLTAGLFISPFLLKQKLGVYFENDPLLDYSIFIWLFYLVLLIGRWKFGRGDGALPGAHSAALPSSCSRSGDFCYCHRFIAHECADVVNKRSTAGTNEHPARADRLDSSFAPPLPAMNVVVIGLSHHSAPVELRERFAFDESKIPAELKLLRESGIVGEAVILSTCNRVEIYAATGLDPARAFAELKQFLLSRGTTAAGTDRIEAGDSIYTLSEPQSLQHLFKVASGLDSMVLGETEILGQLKIAYALAQQHQHTGAKLNKAFQRAFNVAKQIRTETNIQRGRVSVASVAVELAEKIFSSLAERDVLVIGAGEMSEKVARALLSRGAKSIVLANRSQERAQALAQEFGGRVVPFDDWSAEFEKIDIVISSTSAPHYILDSAKLEPLMKARKNRPLLLVDIAVPRDVDPAVNFLGNVYLYNIDDLQAIADDYLKQRKEEIDRCEQIIAEKVRPLLEGKLVRPRMDVDGHRFKIDPVKS